MMRNSASKRSVTLGRALALLPVPLLAVLGCAQIIGLGDYTVASGGSGGTSHQGGSGGSGARAGSSGSGAAAGTGEAGTSSQGGTDTGVGGTRGGSGGSTSGGSGGTTTGGTGPIGAVSCDGTPIVPTQTMKDVLAACLYRSACSPFVPARTISKCLTNNTPHAFAGENCHVGSCAEYQMCEHNGIPGDDICTSAKAGTNFCQGGKRVSCDFSDPNFNLIVDCVALGATGCSTYTDVNNDVQAACTLTGTTTSCVGQPEDTNLCSTESPAIYNYYCIGGNAYGTKCGDFSDCELGLDGTNSCFFQGSSCTATACSVDKKIATACNGSTGYQYDCGSVGLSCAISTVAQADGDTNYCLASGCRPADVNNCTESCDGSLLNLCYGGAQITVDCVDYGFATCDTFSDLDDNLFATCFN